MGLETNSMIICARPADTFLYRNRKVTNSSEKAITQDAGIADKQLSGKSQ